MKKWIWIIILCLVIAGISIFSFIAMNQPVTVVLGEVTQQSMAEKIYVNGKLETKETTSLYSDTNGLIKELKVKEGDKIKKGQVLITLNMDSVAQTLAEEHVSLEITQEERLAAKKEHFEKFRQQQVENPDAVVEPLNLEQFDLRIKSHNIRIQALEKKMNKDEIKANADGTVTELSVNSGQLINEGMPILKVSDFSAYQVVADINEIEAGKVKLGMPVSISGESFEEVYEGKVSKMAATAVVTDPAYKDAYVATTIALQRIGPELRPGYNVNVELAIPDQERVVVPLEAVVQSEGKSYVYKVEQDKAVKVEIQTGKENDEYYEVISGVGLGDKIVLKDVELLADGSKVVVQ
ncbi:efflux RND transporter periplasmic adaptor subunit [Paenibacillus harenae]|uniref:efflux RND transporter periplasmic adaptor subunit n=1 Tax=Paenibacillus harenae TaxID=306543 RepID=UPI0003F664D2|nr:efflux RND transporter periplasmic adaptor subunit [Paenibacillus harenae]